MMATQLLRSQTSALDTTAALSTSVIAQAERSSTPDFLAQTLDFELIGSAVALRAIAPEWDSLYALNHRPSTAFHQFRRVLHWVEAFGHAQAKGRLAIVTGRLGGRLVLVAPFMVHRNLGLRQLVWAGEPVAQYGDILLHPELDGEAAGRAAVSFAIDTVRPDLVRLRNVRCDAAIRPALENLGARVCDTQAAPFLDLASAADSEAFEERYSSKRRRNRRRLRRRLESNSAVSIRTLPPGPEAARVACAALSLKRAWLADRKEASLTLQNPGIDRWIAAMASDAQSGCRVSEMRCDGELASVKIGFRDGARLALYVIVFALRYEKDGAGVLHLEQTIRDCFEDGIGRIDLLAPCADYKMTWADGADELHDYSLPITLIGRAGAGALEAGARRIAKRAYAALPVPVRSAVGRVARRGAK